MYLKERTKQMKVRITIDLKEISNIDLTVEEAIKACTDCMAACDDAISRMNNLEANIDVLKSVGVDVESMQRSIEDDNLKAAKGLNVTTRRIFRHGDFDVIEVAQDENI